MSNIIFECRKGDSLTIGFLFNNSFDMSRIAMSEIWLDGVKFTATTDDHLLTCKIKSDETKTKVGAQRLTLLIDDSVLGVKKIYCGDVKFNNSNSPTSNESVNNGWDVVVPITINEQAITIGDLMYNYVKGDTGSIGDIMTYPEIVTPADEDVTVIQHGNGSVNSFRWSWASIKLSLKNYLDGFFEPLKGSDDNYVTDAEKVKISNLSGTNTGDQDLSGLQPREAGKGLSTNDYTTTEKNKLAGIEAGAQVNAANTVIDANYVHTDNNFTTTLKNKLDSFTAIFTIELKGAYDGVNTWVLNNYVSIGQHLRDIVKHITAQERINWNSAVNWFTNAAQNVKDIIGIIDGGSINKFLTEAGTFAPISVGGASSSPLYYDPTPSGIGTAKTLSYIPYPTEIEAQYTLTSTEQLLASYVHPEPIATDTIDAGNWISKAVGRISSSAGSSFLRLEFSIYKNGVKTLLFSKSSDEINNSTFESIPGDAANGVFAVDPTGFLWVDVYGVTSGANRTLYLKIGDGNASFIQTPLRARHDGLRDLNGDNNFLHVTSSEKQTWNAKQSAGDYATNTALATKVTANAPITGTTKAKITYDAKGLVTGGGDLTVDNIPLLPISKTDGLQEYPLIAEYLKDFICMDNGETILTDNNEQIINNL